MKEDQGGDHRKVGEQEVGDCLPLAGSEDTSSEWSSCPELNLSTPIIFPAHPILFYHCTVSNCQWHPTPVLLPGKSHGWRSLVGCSPWGLEESNMTERLHFHFSLSCIAEGNGNPLQCSCLENPRDGGAWWAAIYGVAQSRTQLKRLSSSSSNCTFTRFPSYLLSFQLDCKIHGANPCLFYALLRI